jgi:2-methylcitrate dehydratase PrpD
MSFTQQIAEWVALTPRKWEPDAIDAAQRAITDTVACLIAGAKDEAPERVMRGLGRWGSQGLASAAGRSGGLDAPWAALINGTAAHALDYDDVLDPAASHVSAVMVPSLLALAEEVDASGADLVDAYIVGVEVQECLAEAVNMVHYTRGWHTTLTLGAPSAAAACARLLRLETTQVRDAVSLATSMAAGFKRQFGTNAKPFHAGLAAKSGIVAARMAAAGLTADAAVFEGERGFQDLMVGTGAVGFASTLRLSGPPAVVAPGLWLKRYPCCASTHRPVDAFLALMREHGLQPADVERVETLVSEAAVRNLMYAQPVNEMQARFSMPYCIAAAAYEGDLTLSTFRMDSLHRTEIAQFMQRVTMASDPQQPADMPSTVKSWGSTAIFTRDGRRFSKTVVDPKGYPTNALDEHELARKFSDCAHGQPESVRASYSTWREIVKQSRMRPMCTVLQRAGTLGEGMSL